jgi:hypothetical protein
MPSLASTKKLVPSTEIPKFLREVEHVFFINRRLGNGDRRSVQKPIRFAVALP